MVKKGNFDVEVRTGNPQIWDARGADLLEVQRIAYSDVLTEKWVERVFAKELEKEMTRADATVFFLLYNDSLVGMTSFLPVYSSNRFADQEIKHFGMRRSQYDFMQRESVEVGTTAILPQFRGQGGWSLLMDRLDKRVAQDRFRHMLRWVREANNYAKKVEGRYEERILFKSSLVCRYQGPQHYLRVQV